MALCLSETALQSPTCMCANIRFSHHGVVCQVLLLSQKSSWSIAGALAEEDAAEGVQGEEEDDSQHRAARLQRGMFMHPNLTLAAALGKPV